MGFKPELLLFGGAGAEVESACAVLYLVIVDGANGFYVVLGGLAQRCAIRMRAA